MNDKGFTTFEIILAIIIFGIILSTASLSINTYKNALERYEYKRFIEDLNFIKNKSKLEKIRYIVKLDTKNQGYRIYNNFDKEVLIDRKFNSGIKFRTNNLNNEIIYTNGILGKGGSVTMEVNGKEESIKLTPVVTKVNEKN